MLEIQQSFQKSLRFHSVSIKNCVFDLCNSYSGQVLFCLLGGGVLGWLFCLFVVVGFFFNKFSQSTIHLLDTLNFWAKNSHKHGVVSLSFLLITPCLSSNTDSFRHFDLKWPLPVLSQETAWTGFPNKCRTHRNYVNVAQLFIQSNR